MAHARPVYFLAWWQGGAVPVLAKALSSHHSAAVVSLAREALGMQGAELYGRVRVLDIRDASPEHFRSELGLTD